MVSQTGRGSATVAPDGAHGLSTRSRRGRVVLFATVLGSSLAGIDATVVGVALPRIGADLHASFAGLQWTVTAYTLTLASFILLGGSLGDRIGQRRVFVVGTVWFTMSSLACAAAPTLSTLVAARAAQGVGGALLTPASLAIIEAGFAPHERSRAVGIWAGSSGVAAAFAPFVGGYLLEVGSWRSVFLINLPLAVVVLRLVPSFPDAGSRGEEVGKDWTGSLLAVVGLGGVSFALIESRGGVPLPWVLLAAAAGFTALASFVTVERREAHPLLPLELFGSRLFVAANLVTFIVYAAIGAFMFLVVLALQVVSGYSALAAGASLLPVTALTFLLSSASGALSERIGPRLQMGLGPLLCAGGCVLLSRLSYQATYATDVFPAVALWGLGLATMVAPLTATALSSAPADHAGVASGVNNAVARAGSLLAVAAIPVLAGLSGASYTSAPAFRDGFAMAALLCAGLLALGGITAWIAVQNPGARRRSLRRPSQGDGTGDDDRDIGDGLEPDVGIG